MCSERNDWKMKEMAIIGLEDATRIVSTQAADDFAYGIEFDIKTPRGDFHVDMDKPGRVLMYGVVYFEPPKGFPNWGPYNAFWSGDERVVAALAKLIDDNWKHAPGAGWPDEGEEVPMPTAEEAKAIIARLGIPQDPEAAKELRAEMEVLNLKGEPPWL